MAIFNFQLSILLNMHKARLIKTERNIYMQFIKIFQNYEYKWFMVFDPLW